MKQLVYRLYSDPQNGRFFSWIKLISITGSAQIIVQAVGFICGIMVIRLLPIQEYALYTIANTMLGTLTLLSDGGISIGVMSQGGKVWQDQKKLGAVLITGLDLRRKFAMGSLVVSTPILVYLLIANGASWIASLLIVASLIPAFYAALSDSLLEIAPKLHQTILPLQKIEVTVGIGRMLLSGLTLFLFPYTFVAILASGIPRIYGNLKLRKISDKFTRKAQLPDPVVRKAILGVVKRVLPGTVYYCLSGQITIWLISIFGSIATVAQIGALGRLAMMLNVISSVLSTLVLPRFARIPDEKKKLFKTFLFVQTGLLLTGCVIISLVYFFPAEILWILGKDYSNLQTELLLSVAGSCLGLLAGSSFALAASRGWAINPLISIPVTIAAVISGIVFLDISTLTGILKFNLFIIFVEIVIYYTYCTIKILRI